MFSNETKLFKPCLIFWLRRSSSREYIALFACFFHLFKSNLISSLDGEAWSSGKISESQSSISSLNSFVAAMDLRPGFFDQEDPKLCSIPFGEAWLAIFSGWARDAFVYDNCLRLTVLNHFDPVHSLRVYLISGEQLFYSIRLFSKNTKYTE